MAEDNIYYFDAENAAEMARLNDQDRVVTKYLGGHFAEKEAGYTAVQQKPYLIDHSYGTTESRRDPIYRVQNLSISFANTTNNLFHLYLSLARPPGKGGAHSANE